MNITLHNAQQGHQALLKLWPWLKARLTAGQRLELEVRREKRSTKQNVMLHAMIGHIAKTQEWAGKKRDIETWKRLLVAAWCRATGEPVEFLPALDGAGVDIVFKRTSSLDKAECADLISFVDAWAAQQGIEFPPPPGSIDPGTGEIYQ